jgi:hypothetical protein
LGAELKFSRQRYRFPRMQRTVRHDYWFGALEEVIRKLLCVSLIAAGLIAIALLK